VRRTLPRVGPLFSLRSDPEHADVAGHRLLFAAFRGLPLFWRLDLDVHADRRVEAGVPAAAATDPRPPAASTPASAVAAVMAVCRGRQDTARGLLERGLLRVGAGPGSTGRRRTDVACLTSAAASEPAQRPPAAAVDALSAAVLRLWPAGPAAGVRRPGGGSRRRRSCAGRARSA
jgi:hypothetical protein